MKLMPTTQGPLAIKKWRPVALGLLWGGVQLALYLHFGPRTSVDSSLYLDNARNLLHGQLPTDYSIWYLGYSAFLAVVLALGGGLAQAVGAQIALSGVAALGLWRAVRHLSGSPGTAHLAVLLYLLWFKIHQWNVFIYTESLFTSCCMLSFALLVLARRPWQLGLALLLVGYTFLVRPTGFCFLIGVAGYGWARLRPRALRPAVLGLLVAGLATGFVALLSNILASYDQAMAGNVLLESYARAELIYPGITLGVQPPTHLALPAAHLAPLVRLVAFGALNPVYFAKLAVLKFLLFSSNVKPYYSWAHNLAVAGLLWPLYFYAVRGWRRRPRRSPAAYFMGSFIAAQALTVALTTENWDGRFLVPVLPYVFVLAALGLRPAPGAGWQRPLAPGK